MSEPINWCDLKKNIKHIGEVSTSRQGGSPSGAKITTSTNAVTGDARDTLDGRLDKISGVYIGEYKAGLTFSSYAEYVVYNGQSYKPKTATTLPFTTTNISTDLPKLAPFDNAQLCREYEEKADASADRAEAAAEAAAASGKIYATVEAGIAATADNELFLVVSDKGGFSDLYLNDSGTGVYQNKTTIDSSILNLKTNAFKTTFFDGFVNVLDPNGEGYGTAGYWSNGLTIIDSVQHKTSNKFKVKGGDNLFFTKGAALTYIKLFDENGDPINNRLDTNRGELFDYVTIPSVQDGRAVAFAVVSAIGRSLETIQIGIGNPMLPDMEVAPNEEFIKFAPNTTLEKRISAVPNAAIKSGQDLMPHTVSASALTICETFTNLYDYDDPTNLLGIYQGAALKPSATYRTTTPIEVPKGQTKIIGVLPRYSEDIIIFPHDYTGEIIPFERLSGVRDGDNWIADIPAHVHYLSICYSPNLSPQIVGFGDYIVDAADYPKGIELAKITNVPIQNQIREIAGEYVSSRSSSVNLPWENMLILGVGQSLMEGSSTSSFPNEPITKIQEFDTMGFGSSRDVIFPATVETTQRGTRGEWSGLGCAAHLRELLQKNNNVSHDSMKSTIVLTNEGLGGAKITAISKGTGQYEAGIEKATNLKTITNQTTGALAVIFMQGESDASSDLDVYVDNLVKLAEDYSADLKIATGQVMDVHLFSYQLSTHRDMALAHVRASEKSDLVHVALPMYHLSYYDGLHIDSVAERLVGAYFARAIHEVQLEGNTFEPLKPIECKTSGNTITLTFNKSGLALDETLVPKQTNYGFAVKDGADDKVITSVKVINSNQVRMTLEEPPVAGWIVEYGTPVVDKSPQNGVCGNLRDSAGVGNVFDNYPLHNWCVIFDYEV